MNLTTTNGLRPGSRPSDCDCTPTFGAHDPRCSYVRRLYGDVATSPATRRALSSALPAKATR